MALQTRLVTVLDLMLRLKLYQSLVPAPPLAGIRLQALSLYLKKKEETEIIAGNSGRLLQVVGKTFFSLAEWALNGSFCTKKDREEEKRG